MNKKKMLSELYKEWKKSTRELNELQRKRGLGVMLGRSIEVSELDVQINDLLGLRETVSNMMKKVRYE